VGEISNDPLSCLIQSEDPASSLEQREDASEENNDPLASFFTDEDLAGFLNQKEEVLTGVTEPLQNYLFSGDNEATSSNTIDINPTLDSVAVGTYLVSAEAVLCPISGIPQLTLELVDPRTPPSSAPPPAISTTSTPTSQGRTGRKRKLRELDSSDSSQSPSKMSKATNWRKEQDKEIAKNDQLLEDDKAKVKEKELFILSHQALLAGRHGEKTFDFARKMAYFEQQKRDIDAAALKLGSIIKSQKKAEYQKAQARLLESFKSYINILNEEIQGINMKINNFP